MKHGGLWSYMTNRTNAEIVLYNMKEDPNAGWEQR